MCKRNLWQKSIIKLSREIVAPNHIRHAQSALKTNTHTHTHVSMCDKCAYVFTDILHNAGISVVWWCAVRQTCKSRRKYCNTISVMQLCTYPMCAFDRKEIAGIASLTCVKASYALSQQHVQ